MPFSWWVLSSVKHTLPCNFHFITRGMKSPRSLCVKNKNRVITHCEKNCASWTTTWNVLVLRAREHGGPEKNAFDSGLFFGFNQRASSREKAKRWVDFFVIYLPVYIEWLNHHVQRSQAWFFYSSYGLRQWINFWCVHVKTVLLPSSHWNFKDKFLN